MIKITSKKGFHIKFKNGWTVSVQFGPGNYCQNYNLDIFTQDEEAGAIGSMDAECAVMNPDGKMIEHPSFDGDTVRGYMSPDDVLELMNWAASQ